ncbi:MAG: tRNA (adenine-N1)-methyltransferase [Actinomycetota bacterium]
MDAADRPSTGPFRAGERVLLVDAKDRHYLVRLEAGGTWHSHGGALALDGIIGAVEGSEVQSASGMVFQCFRPRMADVVLKMPRGAQVVYPKDAAAILVEADVFPGARVLEAGTGSGALTIALCRAVGPSGRVVSYDLRDDFRETARGNVAAFFDGLPGWLDLRPGDVADVSATGDRFDRVVLDLPAPWEPLGAIASALEPGGVLCSYLPTTPQIQSLVVALEPHGFRHVETFEVLHRSWHVNARSVRPDHRMVAHTGFVTIARRGPAA